MDTPSVGRIVIYRGIYGNDYAAIITGTQQNMTPESIEAGFARAGYYATGQDGLAAKRRDLLTLLDGEVHLQVFGIEGMFHELRVPFSDADAPVGATGIPNRTWRWPARV